MTISVAPIAVAEPQNATIRDKLQHYLPRLVLAPSFLLVLVFVYGFNLWTLLLSFTNSKAFTNSTSSVWANYRSCGPGPSRRIRRRTGTRPSSTWACSADSMSSFCLVLGLTLAILLDQKIRGEGILRPIYLYPLALSFIVTGTAWKLFLDPRIGLEKAVHDLGWTSFHFDWVVNPRMMIYCVAIAGIWQTSGFVMAMFLAGLRGIDGEILEGRADRRRVGLRDLPAHHYPDDAPRLHVGPDHPDPHGDQVVRPRSFGHRQEPRAARPSSLRPSCIPTPSPATRWRSAPPARSSC